MKKRIFSLFLALCMALSLTAGLPLTASAASSGTCGGNLTWTLDDEGILTISGTGNMDDYEYDYNYDRSTAPWYKYYHDIKSVIIEDGITSIGDYAFAYCECMESISIPESIEYIGEAAFSFCIMLLEINISENVYYIGYDAFLFCSSLKKITVNDNSDDYCSIAGVLFNYDATELIAYPANKAGALYTVPDSVEYIGYASFIGAMNLVEVVLQGGVLEIGDEAFFDCNSLSVIYLPNSIEYIGWAAFCECVNLTDVYYSGTESEWNNIDIDNEDNGWLTGATIHLGESVNDSFISVSKIEELQSMHPYENDMDTTWVYTHPSDADSLSITFSDDTETESNYDFIYMYDVNDNEVGKYSGNELSGKTVSIDGNVIKIRLVSDGSITKNGFEVTDITASLLTGPITNVKYINRTMDTVTLFFSAPKGATKVTVEKSENGAIWEKADTEDSLNESSTTATVTGLKRGTEYYFRLNVIGGAREGLSNEIKVLTGNYTLDDYFEFSDGVITGYIGDDTVVNIPPAIDGVEVEEIGDNAFEKCSRITSVTIPDTVTRIGEWVFYDCLRLETIDLGNSIEVVGEYAFNGCESLTSIFLPESLQSIDSSAFSSCFSMVNVDVEPSNKCYCSVDGVLFDRDMSTLILYPSQKGDESYSIPETVETIGESAFENCNELKNIEIPYGVKIIEDSAFSCCNFLINISIPESVISIGIYAFDSTGDYNNEANWENGMFYIDDCLIEVKDTVTECTIKNGTRIIAGAAFFRCDDLASIIIPDSVKGIGDNAFHGCSSLTSVTIGNSVESIGYDAFSDCNSLANIYINGIANWCNIFFTDDGANPMCFADKLYICGELPESIEIPKGVTTIPDYTFKNQINLKEVIISDSVRNIGDYTFYNCSSLISVTIPDSVTSIGNNAFYNCSSLTSVTMGKNVTSIDDRAFYSCNSLTNVYISDITNWCNISFANYYANPMYYADRLYINGELPESIEIPKGVTTIPDYTFKNQKNLKEIIISDSVKSIGGSAFCNCSSLTSITIPDSVKSIGFYAFDGCSNLKSAGPIGGGYDYEFGWIESVPDSAFYGCSSLMSITIPNSVTGIGYRSFYNCSSLTDVYYIGSGEQWKKISIGSYNTHLTNATIHYNYKPETDEDKNDSIYMYMESSYCIKGFTTNLTLYITDLAISEKQDGYMKNYVNGLTFKSSNESVAVITDTVIESIRDNAAEVKVTVKGKDFGKTVISVVATTGDCVETDLFIEPKMRMKSITGDEKEKFGFVVTLDEADSEYLMEFVSGISYNINSVSNTLGMGTVPTYTIYHADEKTVEYYVYGTSTGDYGIDVDIISAGGQKVSHKATVKTSYGVPSTKTDSTSSNNSSTTDIEVKNAANKWIRACNDYIALLAEKCEKSAEEADKNANLQSIIENKAKELMNQDIENSWLGLPVDLPEDAKLYCYEALYEAIIAGGERENIDFGSVQTGIFGTINTNTKIVKTIAKAIPYISFEKQYGKYKINISATGFNGAYTGSINVKNLQGYGSYLGMIASPQNATLEVVADYIIALRDLEVSAICSVFTAAASDLKIKSVNDLTKDWIKKNLKKNMKIFQDKGFGQVDEFLGNCVQYYKYVSELNKNTDISDFIGNVKTVCEYADKLSNSSYTASDAALNKAMTFVKNAESELKAMALDYLYGTGYDYDKEDKGFVNFIKSIFKCPVSISVYNSNNELIGYVGDDDIWYDDSIMITQEGDVKTIYSNQGDEIYFDIKGTDYGTLNCVFEKYDNSEPVERTNFYDIPLYTDKKLNCTLLSNDNYTDTNNLIIQSDNEYIYADEKIDSSQNAAANLNVIINNSDYGTVSGMGTYVRGDQAVLTATPNDDCTFIGWFNGEEILSINMVYEFTVKENSDITAKFAKTEYTLEDVFFEVLEMYSDDIDDISSVKNNDSYNITITTKENSNINLDNAKICIAVYDDNDAVKQVNTFAAVKTDNKYVFTVDIPQQEFNVFIWNDHCVPITKVNFSRKQYIQ